MKTVVMFVAPLALLFPFPPAMRAQDSDEVAKLRKENEQLRKEVELLKKEIDQLKKVAKAQPAGADAPKTGAKDLEMLSGTWNIDSMEWGGKGMPKDLMSGYKFAFDGNKLMWEGAIGMMSRAGKISAIDDALHPGEFKIDAGQDPKQIDITIQIKKSEKTLLGIYEIKGDTLKICYYTNNNGRRPTVLASKEGGNMGLIVLTRAKK